MKRIMFVCLGNICRSPMAEFMMKKLVKDCDKNDEYFISSSAVSTEELYNPIHNGAQKIMQQYSIPYTNHTATLLVKNDYEKYDYFIGMDERNCSRMLSIFGGDKDKKVYKLSDFGGFNGDVPDPYWTGDFDSVYLTIDKGIKALFNIIENK